MIQESLRKMPTVPVNMRENDTDIVVNGTEVPKGTSIIPYTIEAFKELAASGSTVVVPANTGDVGAMVAQAMAIYKAGMPPTSTLAAAPPPPPPAGSAAAAHQAAAAERILGAGAMEPPAPLSGGDDARDRA